MGTQQCKVKGSSPATGGLSLPSLTKLSSSPDSVTVGGFGGGLVAMSRNSQKV